MNNITDLLTSSVAIIIYILILTILAIYIVTCIVKKNSNKRLRRQNTMELKRLVEDVNEKINVSSNNMRSIKKPKDLDVDVSSVDVLLQDEKVLTEINQNVVDNNISNIQVQEENMNNTGNNVVETLNVDVVNEPVVNISIASNDENLKTEIEKLYVVSNDTSEQVLENDVVETLNVVLDEDNNNVKDEEVLQYTTIEPQEEEAKRELQKITEQLQKEAMEDNLIEHTEFEDEQEKNAIISMDELMSKADTLYVKNEETQYKDEGNEPISLQDLEEQYRKQKEMMETIEIEEVGSEQSQELIDTIEELEIIEVNEEKPLYEGVKQEKVVLDDFSSVKINKQDIKRVPYQETFKTSPVISPVFGITDKNSNIYSSKTDLELENTANYEKLDEEIRKTNEFLATLKDLQNKLD